MTTTKNNEYIYQQLNDKKKEYKNIIRNQTDNYDEMLRIEREIQSILNGIKENKRKIREKNRYKMKDLGIKK